MKAIGMSGINKSQGFTIVELIVVVVAVVILAAVAIVGYGSWRQQAVNDQLKSDLQGAATAMENARNFGSGYPSSIPTTFVPSQDTILNLKEVSTSEFCIEASASTTTSVFYIKKSGGPQEGECPEAQIIDGSVMQAVNATNCPIGMTRVVDARDSHTYWIQKLDDGKCWMLTNLGYAGGGTATYSDTVSISNGTGGLSTYVGTRYYVIPSTTNFTTEPTNPSTSTNGTGQYGYLYNWCAAMGGQSTAACSSSATPAVNTTTSICPAGWRLPVNNGTTGDFTSLNTAINGGSSTSDAGLRDTWLAQRGGTWTGSFANAGTTGLYWTSTAQSAGAAYVYSVSQTSIASTTAVKSSGAAVRCVAN